MIFKSLTFDIFLYPEESLGPEEDLSGLIIDDEAGNELELALNRSRKLKQKKHVSKPEQELAKRGIRANISEETTDGVNMKSSDNIILNSTSEFCRALGEIPTYGQAGNREDEEDEMMVCIWQIYIQLYLLNNNLYFV